STSTFKQMKWTSSNSNVITIDGNTGVAQAKSIGEADITVTTVANERTDTIKVKVYNKLNVGVYYDQAFATICQNNNVSINQFINTYTATAKEKYRQDFWIDITFTLKQLYHSFPELYCSDSSSLSTLCQHNNEYSYNYHKNIHSILENFTPDTTTNRVNILFTGHYAAISENGFAHGLTNSLTNNIHKTVITINPDFYVDSEYIETASFNDALYYDAITFVITHELGHAFWTPDHYLGLSQEKPGQNDDCIWGDNYREDDVYEELIMCSYCINMINDNSGNFNDY
ncbi:MAG: hypothetical protein IJC49_02810, partial [Clostridia bacterium]|nr:hypothetical protein [Clostridia bacterium]